MRVVAGLDVFVHMKGGCCWRLGPCQLFRQLLVSAICNIHGPAYGSRLRPQRWSQPRTAMAKAMGNRSPPVDISPHFLAVCHARFRENLALE